MFSRRVYAAGFPGVDTGAKQFIFIANPAEFNPGESDRLDEFKLEKLRWLFR